MPSGVTSSDGSRCRFFAQAAPTSTSSTTTTSAPALSSSRSVARDGEGVPEGLPLPEGALEAWQPPLGPPWNWICRRLFRPRQHATCKPAHSKVNKEAMGADVSRIPVAVAPRARSPHRGTALRVEDAVELTSIPDRQLHHNRIHIPLCTQQHPEIPGALRFPPIQDGLREARVAEGGKDLGLRTGPTPGPSSGDIQNTAPLLMLIPASSFHSCAKQQQRMK